MILELRILNELRPRFLELDSEGLRGLFCCACRRLLSGNTTEDIIIVTQSQGLFTQRPFEWDGPEETATVGACEQNDVESLS